MSKYITENRPYFLIPSAFVVEGITRILVFDTERNENFLIPSKYKQLLINDKRLSLNKAKAIYGYSNEEFESAIEFFKANDLIYFTNMKDFYRPIKPIFDYPATITNAIIDIGKKNKFTSQISAYLMEINCFHLQIRYLRNIKLKELKELFSILSSMFVKSVELALTYNKDLKEQELAAAISEQVFIEAVICYGAEFEKKSDLLDSHGQVLYFTKQTLTPLACGIISPAYFTITIPAFTEAKHHNTCLNRKISIDVDGNIKNCPSMSQSYGNIKDTTLQKALDHPDFKKYWNIKKDDITKCKDCEFRYICTDCRAYLEDPYDKYSAPLKCGYNPYTGEWEEWSKNPLKQKVIEYYGMQNLVKKED